MSKKNSILVLGLLFGVACEDGAVLQKGQGELQVEPSSVDFGKVSQGDTAVRTLVITNQGAVGVDVAAQFSEDSSKEFFIEPAQFSIGPRGILSVELSFRPEDAGSDSGELSFELVRENLVAQKISVQAGPIEPRLQIEPDPLTFAPVSSSVETRTARLLNAGQATLNITSVGTDMAGNLDFALNPLALPVVIPPGASSEVAVSYTQSSSAGEGRLTVISDDPTRPEYILRLIPDPSHDCSDGQDNDGDGLVDYPDDPGCTSATDDDEYNVPECEMGTTAPCGTDVGACELGVRECMNGLWGPCEGAINPEAEVCDGVDNDCDRRTDEELTESCTLNGCNGVRSCIESSTISGGSWSDCLPLQASTEICDGIDNDCDGTIDDGISDSCVINSCAGTRFCVPGGTGQYTQCVANNVSPEVCDNADNDCDGFVDEGLPDAACGLGACSRTVVSCINGVEQTCVPGTPTAETCNNLDDDCNGSIDDLGDDTCGVGACQQTMPLCLLGVPIMCTPTSSVAETCNNIDDNCDGILDNVGTSTCGIGACVRSVPSCIAGVSQTCVAGTPNLEVCNNIDDNCDGLTDNIGTINCGRGLCARSVPQCVAGVLQSCVPGTPQTEICNNLDDDCNGVIDDLGDLNCGVGACARTVPQCIAGVAQTCTPGTPTTETCNNIDDDCNGPVDDLPNLVCGVGACERSVTACIAGVPQSCTPGNSSTEVCNDVDDDCNGLVDDIGTWTCGTGACERTVQQCIAGVPQSCVPGTSGTEVCNNIDDDCNGAVDDLPNLTCGRGACFRTVAACAAGAPQTCTPGSPVGETCNNADDDCNGVIDDLGSVSCGRGACARSVDYCVAGVLQTCVPGTAVTETCNTIDDDCNGAVDDLGSLTCGTGACQRTVQACVAGNEQSCVPGVATAEVCNNVDDNCDGAIDNVGTSTCGIGACFRSIPSCVSGVPQACIPGVAITETCNNTDDDCNGVIDDLGSVSCGQGVCVNTVQQCIAGVPQTCTPLPQTGNDADCDTIDQDCDGVPDDHYPADPTTCGQGVCERTGNMACVAGNEIDQCVPGNPISTDDATCDGRDDNCNGVVDEDCVVTVDYSGLWTMDRTIDYQCAAIISNLIYLVDIEFNQINVNDISPNITVTTPVRSGVLAQQPGSTAGTFTSTAPPQFQTSVTYLANGSGCDEIYSFSGTFTSSVTMTGVFTAEYNPASTGGCQDCVNQLHVFSASR